MIATSSLKKMSKEAVVAYLKILSWDAAWKD
jgi:hypothetical protein